MRFRELAVIVPLLWACAVTVAAPVLESSAPLAQGADTSAVKLPADTSAVRPPAAGVVPVGKVKPPKAKIAPVPRSAWMVGFGFGYGTAKPSISGTRPPSETGLTTNLRFGYATSPNTVVGVEMSQWSAKPDSQSWTFRGTMPSITFYAPPYLPRNSYVRAGVGYGRLKSVVTSIKEIYDPTILPNGANRPDTTTYELDDDGFAVLGAVGYEWRWRKHWGLAPQVEYMYITAGQGLSAYVASASMQVNLYW